MSMIQRKKVVLLQEVGGWLFKRKTNKYFMVSEKKGAVKYDASCNINNVFTIDFMHFSVESSWDNKIR